MRFIIFVFFILGCSTAKNYNGYSTFIVYAKTEADNDYLKSLENVDFWSKINKIGQPVTIMVTPTQKEHFINGLKKHGINFSMEIENVQNFIHTEQYHNFNTKSNPENITFTKYLQYEEINQYLAELAKNYPETVTVSSIGTSLENRTVNIIRISANKNASKAPVIFIEAGMHAREWISPALALYIINQLVENPKNSALIENLDWIILPTINPDGYAYTWTTDRLWRKTRSPGVACFGVDGNRNFGFHWMEAGASPLECSETYAGPVEFSEIEARNLRAILARTKNIAAFVSLHSYGQLLFYPYSYAVGAVPGNWQELNTLANRAKDAIVAINGTTYTVGSSTGILYPAAGCSDDWAMGGAGIPIVLTFELPGGGEFGFDLEAGRILGVVEETFEGIKVIANHVRG